MAQDRIQIDPRFLIGAAAIVGLGLAVLLRGVSFSPPVLDGVWFSETSDDRAVSQLLLRFGPDGRFQYVLRRLRGCEVASRDGAAGTWVLTGQRVTMRTVDAHGAALDDEDVFELAWLSASRLDLVTPEGARLSGLRVPEDFDFPPPRDCLDEDAPPARRS